MNKQKIYVLYGGLSTERDVALRSGKAVIEALRDVNFPVEEVDITDKEIVQSLPVDGIVFPILHGTYGEDGQVQKQLEDRGIAYLGADSSSSAVCFDKVTTRKALKAAGIPVAEGGAVNTTQEYFAHTLSKLPHVLKVARGGSSIGTLIVKDPNHIDQSKVEDIFRLDSKAVLEELILGVEITVPVLGQKALPVIEIKPPENQEFDYKNKYNGATQELCPPVSINESAQTQAQRMAERVHAVLGVRHLSRIDMIVRPDGSLCVLELNTMPGMTAQSLFPLSAKTAGYDMPALVEKFVTLVESS